uniref:Uncharacterized protein n=1 Tax=Oryza nivara TaxID=4536 RepID=A0A0E0G8R8_ORYNI
MAAETGTIRSACVAGTGPSGSGLRWHRMAATTVLRARPKSHRRANLPLDCSIRGWPSASTSTSPSSASSPPPSLSLSLSPSTSPEAERRRLEHIEEARARGFHLPPPASAPPLASPLGGACPGGAGRVDRAAITSHPHRPKQAPAVWIEGSRQGGDTMGPPDDFLPLIYHLTAIRGVQTRGAFPSRESPSERNTRCHVAQWDAWIRTLKSVCKIAYVLDMT